MKTPTIRGYLDLYQKLLTLHNRLSVAGIRRLSATLNLHRFSGFNTNDRLIHRANEEDKRGLEARAAFKNALQDFLNHPFSREAQLSRKTVKNALKFHLRIDVRREGGKLCILWK